MRGLLHLAAVTDSPASPRRFYLRTYGCQMNEHDSERIAGLLAADGMEVTEDLESADVVVLNTCCIRENADNKLYGHLGRLKVLKAQRPDLQIAVGGCLAQKDRELIIERAGHVDVVFGTHNLARAPALLARARLEGPIVEILEETERSRGRMPGTTEQSRPDGVETERSRGRMPGTTEQSRPDGVETERSRPDPEEHEAYPSALPAQRANPFSAWVTIQVGCDNSCTFCIVPIVRGSEISRRMGDIVREAEQLAADGVRELTLLGQNVNSYGRDLGAGQYRPQFADLLRALDAVEGIDRIRFTSPHPKDLRPETIAAMAECASLCEHLHLPLQSGSDRTLARMHRGYTAARYLERLAAARDAIADLAVTTDLIVGFPGETDDDFARTLEVVDAAGYDAAYTFVFSPRPGTPAADMQDDFVAPGVVQERMRQLTEVVERHALAKHVARVGRVEQVLVEGPSKKDDAMWSGRTRQNKLVHFAPGDAKPAPGDTARVQVTRAAPHWLRGELLDSAGSIPSLRPTRTRIPVTAAPA
ncbi:MAG: MiaB/RimO family radical SAM methylthiotransferase [Acidimicrobiia bacterium]